MRFKYHLDLFFFIYLLSNFIIYISSNNQLFLVLIVGTSRVVHDMGYSPYQKDQESTTYDTILYNFLNVYFYVFKLYLNSIIVAPRFFFFYYF